MHIDTPCHWQEVFILQVLVELLIRPPSLYQLHGERKLSCFHVAVILLTSFESTLTGVVRYRRNNEELNLMGHIVT